MKEREEDNGQFEVYEGQEDEYPEDDGFDSDLEE
jgi:hypothetical protein